MFSTPMKILKESMEVEEETFLHLLHY